MEFPEGRLDLYLTDISEPEDNTLRIVLVEAVLGQATALEIGEAEIENVHPMEIGGMSRVIEVYWPSYVAYSMRNESYWDKEVGEPDFKSHLYTRSNSAFLNYVLATTFATDDYPGPFEHWGLDTLNHCLAVVSTDRPRIRQLTLAEVGRQPTNLNFAKGSKPS